MTAPRVAAGGAGPAAPGPGSAGSGAARAAPSAKKSRGGAWAWILVLLLLGGIGTAAWWFWPRLAPTLQRLPLVGRLIPGPTPGTTQAGSGGSAPANGSGAGTSAPGSAGASGTAGAPIESAAGTGGAGNSGGQPGTVTPTQADLQAKAAQLDQLAKKLEAERQQLEREKAAQAGVQRVASVYRQMRPATAATILSNMADSDLLPILLALPDDQVAGILASLDASRAAQLTQKIAAVKASPPPQSANP